jgi:ethanolamine utilization protein EutA
VHDDELEHLHLEGLESAADAVYISEHAHFRSVGIDIGSSTSHLTFSELVLARQGHQLSSRFAVVRRRITAQSPVRLTPYRTTTVIDTEELRDFIARAYAEAGLTPDQIDTGAVIVTGEASKKENAGKIIHIFSAQAGKFVCASAGPNLEGLLAAHGSGAVAQSKEEGTPIIFNVDVGGGTSKLARIEKGRVVDTAATNVGARLIAWDPEGIIVRVEEAGRLVACAAGFDLRVGEKMPEEAKEPIADLLAEILLDAMRINYRSPLSQALMLTDSLQIPVMRGPVIFSGGTSDFVYERTAGSFGDLGPWLGAAIRRRILAPELGYELLPAQETIRATVIGASQYAIQVSGNTIHLTDPCLLPMRNLHVLAPRWKGEASVERVAESIRTCFRRYDLEEGKELVVVAFHWDHGFDYRSMRGLADGIVQALPRTIAAGLPLILVFDHDIAGLVGSILKREMALPNDVISIDQILLHDLDFIDIGTPVPDSGVVPVVVKSLVFR